VACPDDVGEAEVARSTDKDDGKGSLATPEGVALYIYLLALEEPDDVGHGFLAICPDVGTHQANNVKDQESLTTNFDNPEVAILGGPPVGSAAADQAFHETSKLFRAW